MTGSEIFSFHDFLNISASSSLSFLSDIEHPKVPGPSLLIGLCIPVFIKSDLILKLKLTHFTLVVADSFLHIVYGVLLNGGLQIVENFHNHNVKFLNV